MFPRGPTLIVLMREQLSVGHGTGPTFLMYGLCSSAPRLSRHVGSTSSVDRDSGGGADPAPASAPAAAASAMARRTRARLRLAWI